jgi:Bacterial CdiA-CT RNAse A domain
LVLLVYSITDFSSSHYLLSNSVAVEKPVRVCCEMKRSLTTICFFTLLFWASGCRATPDPGLPEIPRGEMPSAAKSAQNSPPDDASRYDLARDEARGGHTLGKHVGRSDQELRERLDRERNISAASTWTNREVAEETVAQALRAEHDKIARWEERGYRRPNLALHFDAGRVVGRSMRHGDESSSPATEAVIILKADGPTSFYVLTSYPEDRR